MAFDLKAFEKTKFESRTADVPVPELKDFFDEEEEAVWTVRNLTASEIAKVEMSGQNVEKMKAILEGITSDKPADIANSIKELAGVSNDLEPEFRKHLTRLELASVNPKITRQIAVKLADVSGSAFYRIIAQIKELSGKGAVMGKLQASTKTPK
jgi:hypothetical protein